MLAQDHPHTELTDYVLDLLSPEDKRLVDRHLQQCPDCRARLHQERSVIGDARRTLLAITAPSEARLRQLAPRPATFRSRRLQSLLRPAVAFSLVLLLFVVSIQLYGADPARMPVYQTATTVVATATVTPTSTAEPLSNVTLPKSRVSVRLSPARPAGTPIAALFAIAQNKELNAYE